MGNQAGSCCNVEKGTDGTSSTVVVQENQQLLEEHNAQSSGADKGYRRQGYGQGY